MTKSFADYENPPVVETVLGLQFDPLPKMRNAHLGAFWKTLPAEWDAVTDAPSLEPQLESFTDAPNWGVLRFKVTQDLANRLQIRNRNGDSMIQVQNGRVHVNWLGHGKSAYPRYEQVRKTFDHSLEQFTRFARQEGLGEIRPNQWEVTYINRIPKGTVWHSPDDWRFFRPLGAPVRSPSVQLESFGGEWHYEIADHRGRLHVQFQHLRQSDALPEEAVVINLTARGGVDVSGNGNSWASGLDLGHEVIVTSFRNFMSDSANNFWGIKDGNG
jgi:uncharacterized protein (TIGR04255 family)